MVSVRDSAISTVSPAKFKNPSLEGQTATMYEYCFSNGSEVEWRLQRQVGDTIYLHFSSRKGE